MSFTEGKTQLPPGTQPTLVVSDAEGNHTPIQQPPAESAPAEPSEQKAEGANPPVDPPEGKEEKKPEQKEEPKVAAKKPKTPSSKPKGRSAKKPTNDAVLSRARRMNRQDRKKIWAALRGPEEEYSDDAFDEWMANAEKDRLSAMSEGERTSEKIKALEAEKLSLLEEKQKLQSQLTEARQETMNLQRQIQDEKMESELRELASKAGITDTDYALYRLRRHILEDLSEGQEPDVENFFTELKKDPSAKHLFREEEVSAGPEPVANQQQQQQQQQQAQQQGTPPGPQNPPNQTPPKPASQGGAPQIPNALEMSDQDYRQYVQKTYGVTPGRV